MAGLSLGLIALGVVAALVYFGVAQRVLDRMRLTDTQALLFIALMIVGSFITLPVLRGRTEVTVNAGGFLVPLALAVYLFLQAGTAAEKTRAAVASIVTGATVWALSSLTDFGPHGGRGAVIDPLWLFGLLAGAIAYALGRSRRAAFISGVLGVILADVAAIVGAWRAGRVAVYPLGGGGAFDALVLAGIVGVALAEVFGEAREALQGGPDHHRAAALEQSLKGPGGPYEGMAKEARREGGEAREGDSDGQGGEPRY